MRKGIFAFVIAFMLILVSLSVASAYYFQPYGSDSYTKTVTTDENDVKTNNNYWGNEKVTTHNLQQVTTEINSYYPNQDYYSCMNSNDCYGNYGSSFRYREPYNYYDYGRDAYGQPYYYQPMYDPNLEYYNWRY